MNLYAFNPLKQNDKQEVLTPVAFNLVLSLPEQLLKRLDRSAMNWLSGTVLQGVVISSDITSLLFICLKNLLRR
jgi:hypothetical protein